MEAGGWPKSQGGRTVCLQESLPTLVFSLLLLHPSAGRPKKEMVIPTETRFALFKHAKSMMGPQWTKHGRFDRDTICVF